MIEDYFTDVVETLFVNQAVSSFRILREEVAEEEGYIRVKCFLRNSDILEFSEFVVIHKNKLIVETYSYHWQKSGCSLIKRWDNVPHHENIDTFPHHLHLAEDKVVSSTKVSLKIVLDEIEKTIIR